MRAALLGATAEATSYYACKRLSYLKSEAKASFDEGLNSLILSRDEGMHP